MVAFLSKDGAQEQAPFDEKKALTHESAKEFFDGIVAGKVAKFVKSEPIPESNDGPVKIVVADNYDAIVNDNTKDVLVEFYAPWCPHCKNIEPIYNSVGEKLKDVTSLVLAKIDATANTIPDDLPVTGFPTLLLFNANNKGVPVEFDGDRTVKGIIKFVQENASVKFTFDLSTIPDEEEVDDENFDDFEDGDYEDDEGDEDVHDEL